MNKVAGDRAAESAQHTRWLRRGNPPTVQGRAGPPPRLGRQLGSVVHPDPPGPCTAPPTSRPLQQEPPHPPAVGADLTLGTRQQEL